MDIEENEEELEDGLPLKTATGTTEQIDVYPDRITIRDKGILKSHKTSVSLKPSQITSIIIKPAGTLYNGNMEITASGYKHTVEFKGYQQADFEQIKVLLAK